MTHIDFAEARAGNLLACGLGVLACAALLLASVTVSGCKKSSSPQASSVPVETTASPATNPATPPVYQPPPAPVVIAAAPGGGADLTELNHAYIHWIVKSHIRPKNFDEFAAKSGIHIPPPPAGKKYIIDKAGFIALANQ